MLKMYIPYMVLFMKTKIDSKRVENVRRKCGFNCGIDMEAEGSRGGLCLAWKDDVRVDLRSFSKIHIDVLFSDSEYSKV